MKNLIILLLVVSCGKDAPKKGANGQAVAPVSLGDFQANQEKYIEMVNVKCDIQHACQTECIDTFIACVDPCGGQGPDAAKPVNAKCQDSCMKASVLCYSKIIEIPKEEFERIMNN